MKLLVILLLYLSRAAAGTDSCTDCEDGVTCIVKGNLKTCEQPTECNITVLLVTTPDFVHVYKNEQASIEFNITSINVTDESVIVIYPNGTNASLAVDGESEEISNHATKEMEGSYIFKASGTYTDASNSSNTACAARGTRLYVFTVSISLEKSFYAFKKDTTSTIHVTVKSEAGDWSRIHLTEYSPLSKEQILDSIDLDKSEAVYIYPYQLSTPTNGVYTFGAKEISPYMSNAVSYNTTAKAQVYVLTTDITVGKESYYATSGGNVSIPLTIRTEIPAENITIQVTKPGGEIDNITDINLTQPVIYNVYHVGEDDFGKYKFTAYEIVDGQGPLLSSQTGSLLYSYTVNVTTNLGTDESGHYIAMKGDKSKVECYVTEDGQNVTWQSGEAETVPILRDVPTAPVYQFVNGTKAILHITDRADFDSSGVFTCSNEATKKSITISVEGPPEQTTLVFADDTFTCTSKGNPPPELIWHMENITIEDLFESSTNTTTTNFMSTSTLSPKADLSCLGNRMIECIANNSYSSEVESIPTIDGNASVFFDEYVTFRNEIGNFEIANTTCGGGLVTLKTDGKKSFVETEAERNQIYEFFIGVTKNASGNWVYLDGSPASLVDEGGPVDNSDKFTCAKYSGDGSTWKSQPCDCSEDLAIVCEVKDDDPPRNLQITPDECNGAILNISWESPANVTAQNVKIDGVLKSSLPPSVDEATYDDLNEDTSYTIRVEAVRDYCQLYPFTESSASTTGPPNPPENPQLVYDETSCNMAWSQSDNGDKTDAFMITLISNAVVDENTAFSEESKIHIVNGTTFDVEITMAPNTNYTATIYSTSCAGNSSKVKANGTCISPIGAPTYVQPPLWPDPDSVSDGTLETSMPASDNRSGPVSCQFMVVHYVGVNDSANADMSQERFDKIKQANDPVNPGEEYFAYATLPSCPMRNPLCGRLSNTKKLTLGAGGTSGCEPLPETSSNRKRRSSTEGDSYSAKNRKLPYGQKFRFFVVDTVVDEEKPSVYMSKSISSQVYVVDQREAPPGNDATVIVLSILVVIIFAGIVYYLFRRWRRPTNRPSFLRFSYSANSENDYDAL